MKILTLDLGPSVGWAAHNGDGGVYYGTVRGLAPPHWATWRQELHALLERCWPDLVLFDTPATRHHMSDEMQRLLWGQAAIAEMTCAEYPTGCQRLIGSEVTAWFLGSSPSHRIARAWQVAECERRGWIPQDPHQAAALAILAFAAHANGIDEPWTKPGDAG